MNLKPQLKTETINAPQTAVNISKQIARAINNSTLDAEVVAPKFKRNSVEATAETIFQYCKQNLPYQRETSNRQTARTLARIIYDSKNGKKFDCKHYTIFVASILKGLKMPYEINLISQNHYDKNPTHIYVNTVDEQGNKIFIDPCLFFFNHEARYNYKYKLKN